MTSSSNLNAVSSGSSQFPDAPAAASQTLTYQYGPSPNDLNSILAGTSTQPYYPPQADVSNPYYKYSSWQSAWPSSGGYVYPTNYQATQASFVQYQPQNPSLGVPHTQASARLRSSPSPPLPESYRHWDESIVLFLKRLGMAQAVAGFEADILVMSPVWEERKIPDALSELSRNITLLGKSTNIDDETTELSERPLEERKLDYIHLANGAQPLSPSSINKSISAFLARNRARNDASNRAEFVYTLAEKRALFNGDVNIPVADISSCARVDMKPVDRDVQMKYDVAKNEEGPLSRTVKLPEPSKKAKGQQKAKDMESPTDVQLSFAHSQDGLTPHQHPGLDERLKNIESHFAVRYVPSPPRFLLDRLKFLENHIIRLEKEYPPWAALHFNQPNRGWPPSPRSTPIIVPAHLRLPTKDNPAQPVDPEIAAPAAQAGKPKFRKSRSSLHRAVMERLEVQHAMNDLTPGSGT